MREPHSCVSTLTKHGSMRSAHVQDWLAQFIVSWHQNTGKLREGTVAAHTDIDASLAGAPPAVAALVPSLHALLRSDPFSPERQVAAADSTRALLLLWASLAPQDLLLCIYPMLVAVENVEHVEVARCPLALATLQVCPGLAACAGSMGSINAPDHAFSQTHHFHSHLPSSEADRVPWEVVGPAMHALLGVEYSPMGRPRLAQQEGL